MYVPKHFSESCVNVMHELIRKEPLGTLVVHQDGELVANHIPFIIHTDKGAYGTLHGHVAITNPIVNVVDVKVLVVFTGVDMYITPSWYDKERENGEVVPTWNYVAVHASGTMKLIRDAAWLRNQLEQLVDVNESQFEHKWKISDAPEQFVDALAKGIVGIEIEIEKLEGKWKVSQNQPEYNRVGVIEALRQRNGNGDREMADLIEKSTQ